MLLHVESSICGKIWRRKKKWLSKTSCHLRGRGLADLWLRVMYYLTYVIVKIYCSHFVIDELKAFHQGSMKLLFNFFFFHFLHRMRREWNGDPSQRGVCEKRVKKKEKEENQCIFQISQLFESLSFTVIKNGVCITIAGFQPLLSTPSSRIYMYGSTLWLGTITQRVEEGTRMSTSFLYLVYSLFSRSYQRIFFGATHLWPGGLAPMVISVYAGIKKKRMIHTLCQRHMLPWHGIALSRSRSVNPLFVIRCNSYVCYMSKSTVFRG